MPASGMSTPQKKKTPNSSPVNVRPLNRSGEGWRIAPSIRVFQAILGTRLTEYAADSVATWTDARSLDEADLDADPHQQFRRWLQEAIDAGERMPNAMALATVSRDGMPSVRMVLCEDADARGFAFQTNLASPKAR